MRNGAAYQASNTVWFIVRPLENTTEEYESYPVTDRLWRAKGGSRNPCLNCSLDRDAAAIVLVDSNLHRSIFYL